MDTRLREAMKLQLRRNHTPPTAHEVALYRVECRVQGRTEGVWVPPVNGVRTCMTAPVAKSLARHLRRCGFEARAVYPWQ